MGSEVGSNVGAYTTLKSESGCLRPVSSGPNVPITVWKFQKFPATQIYHEINLRDFRSLKTAILTHSTKSKIQGH